MDRLRRFLGRATELREARGAAPAEAVPETMVDFGALVAGSPPPRLRRGIRWPFLGRIDVALTCDGGVLRVVAAELGQVVFWDTVPFDSRLVSGPLVLDPRELGRSLREALRRRAIPLSAVQCAVPGFGAVARVVEIARRGRRPRPIVAQDVARSLGVSPSRFEVFWHEVEQSEAVTEVFGLAVPRDATRGILEAMQFAGIRAQALDLRAIAVGRAIGQFDGICVYADQAAIDVCIVLDELPHLIHSQRIEPQASAEEIVEVAAQTVAEKVRHFQDLYPGSGIPTHVPLFLGGPALAGLRAAERLRRHLGRAIGSPTPHLSVPAEFPLTEYLPHIGLLARDS